MTKISSFDTTLSKSLSWLSIRLKSGIDCENIDSDGLLRIDLDRSSWFIEVLNYKIDCLDASYVSFLVL